MKKWQNEPDYKVKTPHKVRVLITKKKHNEPGIIYKTRLYKCTKCLYVGKDTVFKYSPKKIRICPKCSSEVEFYDKSE